MHTSSVLPADADSGGADSRRSTSTKNHRNYFCRNYFCRPFFPSVDEYSFDCFRRDIADSQVLFGNASIPHDFGPIVVEEFHSAPTIL